MDNEKFLFVMQEDELGETEEDNNKLAQGLRKGGIFINEAPHGKFSFWKGEPTKEDLNWLYEEEAKETNSLDLLDEIVKPNIL